jgi:DNA-binding phage protein
MRKMRTLDEIEIDFFHEHPEEIEGYISVAFDEYGKDGNMAAFLAALQVVEQVQGSTDAAMSDKWVKVKQELLKEGSPKFESINSIINSLGYQLVPRKRVSTN